MTDALLKLLRAPWLPPERGKSPYAWLLFLLFFLLKYGYVKPSALELACLAVSILAFVPMYLASYWQNPRRVPLHVLGSCLLGVLWAPYNPGAVTFFMFGAAMSANMPGKRDAWRMIGVTMAAGVGASFLAYVAPQWFILQVVLGGVPIGMACIVDAELRRSRDALIRKNGEVEHMATIAERERISRDLHDLLGHTLSLITLKAELARRQFERDPQACRQEIADIESIARDALAQVREAVTGYRSHALAGALATVRASLRAAGVALVEQIDPVPLTPQEEHALASALVEAATNVIRHARASECRIALSLEHGQAVLRVEDNGSTLAQREPSPGNGLAGMRERIMAIGGQLSLRVERGLALELRLPLREGA